MPSGESVAGAAGRASIAAGPIFLVLVALMGISEFVSQPIELSILQIFPVLALLFLSVLVGAIVAFPLCLVAGLLLAAIGGVLPLARAMAFWLMVAAAMAVAIFDVTLGFAPNAASLAFTLTAVACAAMVRTRLHWD